MRSGERSKKLEAFCAGVAHYFDIDPTIVRVIWGVLAFCYGAGVLAYLICGQLHLFLQNIKLKL